MQIIYLEQIVRLDLIIFGLPLQVLPLSSNFKPLPQEHLYEPSVFLQVPSHGPRPLFGEHSFISKETFPLQSFLRNATQET